MEFTKEELTEARRQIASTIHKLRETVKTLEGKERPERYKAQITLAARRINVDIILQSVGRDNTKDISFTVSDSQREEAMEVVEELKGTLRAKGIDAELHIFPHGAHGQSLADHTVFTASQAWRMSVPCAGWVARCDAWLQSRFGEWALSPEFCPSKVRKK